MPLLDGGLVSDVDDDDDDSDVDDDDDDGIEPEGSTHGHNSPCSAIHDCMSSMIWKAGAT